MIIKFSNIEIEVEHDGDDLVGFVAEEKPDFPGGMFEVEINGETIMVEPVEAYSEDGKYHFSFARVE